MTCNAYGHETSLFASRVPLLGAFVFQFRDINKTAIYIYTKNSFVFNKKNHLLILKKYMTTNERTVIMIVYKRLNPNSDNYS